jgi:hypothetical protein
MALALAACGTTGSAVKANPTDSTEANQDGASTSGGKLNKKDAGNMERAEQDE